MKRDKYKPDKEKKKVFHGVQIYFTFTSLSHLRRSFFPWSNFYFTHFVLSSCHRLFRFKEPAPSFSPKGHLRAPCAAAVAAPRSAAGSSGTKAQFKVLIWGELMVLGRRLSSEVRPQRDPLRPFTRRALTPHLPARANPQHLLFVFTLLWKVWEKMRDTAGRAHFFLVFSFGFCGV